LAEHRGIAVDALAHGLELGGGVLQLLVASAELALELLLGRLGRGRIAQDAFGIHEADPQGGILRGRRRRGQDEAAGEYNPRKFHQCLPSKLLGHSRTSGAARRGRETPLGGAQNPVPIWNWSRWVRSPSFALSG